MTKVEEIERAISSLAPEELAKFRRWYAVFEAAQFDQCIERDAKSGRLDGIARLAVADFAAGRTRRL
ncbi:MAG TPA: hypothetical protein VG894_09945 [Bauldia sp.]|nr:hypothetical protein [Bauldia sp.]